MQEARRQCALRRPAEIGNGVNVARTRIFHPVKHAVVHQIVLGHHRAEKSAQVVVVGILRVAQTATVHEIVLELQWQSRTQLLHRHALLRLKDAHVLVLLVLRLHSLPRKAALQEIDEHVAERLQVVATRLLDAQVVGDGSVPRRPRKILALAVPASQKAISPTECAFQREPTSIVYTVLNR